MSRRSPLNGATRKRDETCERVKTEGSSHDEILISVSCSGAGKRESVCLCAHAQSRVRE